ncbi:MAG: FAD-dependent oxidoreductase [Planctomycetaceae bacterium]
MKNGTKLTILGGGPAGLALGYYAQKSGIDFGVYEAAGRVGGNCVTLQHGEFRFDSGAHRFHDKDPEVTAEIQQLVGDDLRRIEVPSQIWHAGRFVDFPLSPLNLFQALGPISFTRAGFSLLRGRMERSLPTVSFLDFAVRTYGRDIASRFLLSYSEKLWGAPCDLLSPQICGARLKGLGLTSLVIEALRGNRAKTEHLDGAFYYPRTGYGAIVERLADACGDERVRLRSRITRLHHRGNRIEAIEINGAERVPVDEVACTLPLGLLLQLLHPAPPADILESARKLRHRNVVLVAIFLNREQVSPNGSIYFPDPAFPFTRVYEPKNRSLEMAPPGKTSLIAEIPCQEGDAPWKADEQSLVEMVADHFARLGWLKRDDIVGSTTHRLHHAYPILELKYEECVNPALAYLHRFRNLKLAGRNGCFEYTHLHDLMRQGLDAVRQYAGPGIPPRPAVERPRLHPAASARA